MFKLRQRTIIETLLVISCIALIIYFMPRDTKFNYYFSLNTPWGYGQLMSDFDFPIYKSKDMLQAEHDSLRKSFQPYFDMDTQITVQALEQFRNDYNSKFHIKSLPIPAVTLPSSSTTPIAVVCKMLTTRVSYRSKMPKK